MRLLNYAYTAYVTLLLFTVLLCNRTSTGNSDPPIHIHLTWQHSDMSNTITITWQTAFSDSGNTVLYDNVSRSGDPALYRYSASGKCHTYPGASGYIHEVELTGLKPGLTYYFICGGNGGYSEERCFQTIPVNFSHLRFAVGGDCRGNWSQRDIMFRAMSEFNPDFILLVGDFVTSGNNQTQWDSFFESLHENLVGSNGFTIPIIPCLGNHEENATNYYGQFALPGNEQWYSLDIGETVHIVVLNSEANPSEEQLQWLENDLKTHENYTWKFAMFHRPPFSSSKHGCWTEGRQYWCPLFDKYHVDIVFSGHDHNYERTKPINWTASKTSPQPSYSRGTMYIVSAGLGAPLYESGTEWWTAYSRSVYHFVIVDIFANKTLNLQAKNASGATFDKVLQKTPVIPEFQPRIFLSVMMATTTLLSILLRKHSKRTACRFQKNLQTKTLKEGENY